MSDYDDIGDELLELAGAEDRTQKKRPAQGGHRSSTKRARRSDPLDTESEEEPESEEQDVNPYPLEGKYKDEEDRQTLLQMSELEREEILAQRVEELDRLRFKQSVNQLAAQAKAGADDSVANAAKRQHTQRGATKEKSRKLDELKARRKAKDEKKRNKFSSPKRDRSSSPMDMETSDEEEEDGQITRLEQEEEKERKIFGKPDDEPISLEDLECCRLTRDRLTKYCMAPWFEEYIKGAWVRYLIGCENGSNVYRICEISNLVADPVKPYKVNEKVVNQAFELKHGKSVRNFLMDKVSNSPFEPKEFDRLLKDYAADGEKLPSKLQLEKKAANLTKLATQPMTESDIAAMLAHKKVLQPNKQSAAWITMEKSRLTQARTLAMRRQDWDEVKTIDDQLKELTSSTDISSDHEDELAAMLAKVNERNRKANLEAVRKAELLEADRKRRERKLAAAGGNMTPTHDPSARLKTRPRVFNAATPSSRPGTPNLASTPVLQPQADTTTRPISPLPVSTQTFVESVEVDLGDF